MYIRTYIYIYIFVHACVHNTYIHKCMPYRGMEGGVVHRLVIARGKNGSSQALGAVAGPNLPLHQEKDLQRARRKNPRKKDGCQGCSGIAHARKA